MKGLQGKVGNVDEKVREIDDYLLSLMKPKVYHGSKGAEIQMLKNFENSCILLTQHNVSSDPRSMTTLSFYQGLETVKKQSKPKQKGSRKK